MIGTLQLSPEPSNAAMKEDEYHSLYSSCYSLDMMVTPGTVLVLLLPLPTPPPEHVQVSCGTPMQNDQTLCIYGMFSPLLGSDECHGSSHIGITALHVAALRCRRGLLVQVVCVGLVQRQPSVPLLLFFVTALWMLLMLGRYPGLFPDLSH